MFKSLIFATLVVAAAAWNGQMPIFPGPCRTVDDIGGAKENFNVPAYLGLWFEIERYEAPDQAEGECVQAQYNIHGSLPGVEVVNTKKLVATGTWRTDVGRGVVSFPDEDPVRGMLNVTFPDTNLNTPVSNYWIMETDYVNYAIIGGCQPLANDMHRDNYSLLSRVYPISAATRAAADRHIDAFLRREYIRPTQQGIAECFSPRP